MKRVFIPMTRNIASVVTNKESGKTYDVSTVEYEEYGFWEIAVAEHALPFSDFQHPLYTTKTNTIHEAVVEHVKVEYMVLNVSPEYWSDIMIDTIHRNVISEDGALND